MWHFFPLRMNVLAGDSPLLGNRLIKNSGEGYLPLSIKMHLIFRHCWLSFYLQNFGVHARNAAFCGILSTEGHFLPVVRQ